MTDQAGVDEPICPCGYCAALPPLPERDEPQTAIMLTQQEWDDLCGLLKQYKLLTDPVMRPGRTCNETREVLETVVRSRALAERIIEANQ